MSRRFVAVLLGLASIVAFAIGLVTAGALRPLSNPATSAMPPLTRSRPAARPAPGAVAAPADFARIAERLNPAVVAIDAAVGGRRRVGRHDDRDGTREPAPDQPSGEFRDPHRSPDPDAPRSGSGSGFIIEPDGHILTNYHVIEEADRILVRLADGRTLRARVVGSDPATDLALIKIEVDQPLPTAPLGDSSTLRVGEWVCAIGNPLEYEHTVTVGVVSSLGRKLFDASFDDYIQTDAAINLGNSGGPLINAAGDVVGVSAAMSWSASSIGFAIPINQAKAVLPQLRQAGRVSRGYMGVALRDIDPDLARGLKLDRASGALVQDVEPDSPGAEAGVQPYDLIVAVDDLPVATNDALVRYVAARKPGSEARLQVLRDGREVTLAVRLAERPDPGFDEPARRPQAQAPASRALPASPAQRAASMLGMTVQPLDRATARRFELPANMNGVVVIEVEPMGPAEEAGLDHGDVILEINRQPVRSLADYLGQAAAVRSGDVLAIYTYVPAAGQRALRAIRVEPWQP